MKNSRIDTKPLGMGEYLVRVYNYRTLILVLAKRELKVKYAQTSLGLLWTIVQPLIALVIFSVFFSGLIHLETGTVPYPVFAFSGMIIWFYFTNIIQQSGSAVNTNEDLIKKVYFPRLILPLSRAILCFVEFLISFIVFIILMLIWGAEIKITILFVPLVFVLVTLTGLSVSIWQSAISIKKRDLMHLIPNLINFGIWLTPVFYPTTIIPNAYQNYMFYLNPLATLIELFRSLCFGLPFNWMYCLSLISVALLFISGVYVFKNTERNIADYV